MPNASLAAEAACATDKVVNATEKVLLAVADQSMAEVSQTSLLLKFGGSLFLVLALILLGFWLLRKFGPKMGIGGVKRGDLELVGQMPLGPKRGVAVVRFQQQLLVLGVTENRISLLTKGSAQGEPEPGFEPGFEPEFKPAEPSGKNNEEQGQPNDFAELFKAQEDSSE